LFVTFHRTRCRSIRRWRTTAHTDLCGQCELRVLLTFSLLSVLAVQLLILLVVR